MSPYAQGKRDAGTRTDNRDQYFGEARDEYEDGYLDALQDQAEARGDELERDEC